jgi:hypothetical protein
MIMNDTYHLRNLLTKVRRILPEHADCIEEARDRGANEGWLADARKQLNDAQEAVDAAEAWLHD